MLSAAFVCFFQPLDSGMPIDFGGSTGLHGGTRRSAAIPKDTMETLKAAGVTCCQGYRRGSACPERGGPPIFGPISAEIDEEKCENIGLARCPLDITSLEVADGRKVGVTNSGFGTVFGVVDGQPKPVCDYAGFAPFGFSYRRCPGEQLTVQVFEYFLRKVWRDKIVFRKLDLTNPGRVPIGPNAVIDDNIGFSKPA
jgi:hypothetical protein